ncbi:unnamed protein product, partial [Symbiodinium microadriaticum]
EQDPSEVGLVEPGELVRVLLDGDLRLVRGEFLVDLASEGLSFPRRQEAELAFTLSGRSALVSLAEVQREAGSPVSDRQIDIVCVSHRWEAREHPDPCRLLGQKVNS